MLVRIDDTIFNLAKFQKIELKSHPAPSIYEETGKEESTLLGSIEAWDTSVGQYTILSPCKIDRAEEIFDRLTALSGIPHLK